MIRAALVAALFAAAALSGCGGATPAPRTGAATPTAADVAPRKVQVDDLYELGYVSELEVAPDGAHAIYTWNRADRKKDEFATRLFRLDLVRGGDGVAISEESAGASSPKFSPDGRFLAWLEATDAGTALRWATFEGGRLGRPRTSLAVKSGLSDFEWAPDGERFVVVRKDAKPKDAKASDPYVVTRSQARADGTGFLDGRRRHLWIVSREASREPARQPRQITFGPFDDGDPAWSPDGSVIAFVSNRAADPDATDNTDIWFVSPDPADPAVTPEATAKVSGPGGESAPAWSHRGERLAFHSLRRANDYYQPQRVMTLSVASGELRDLTGELDAWVASDALPAGGSPVAPIWSKDDARLTVSFERTGATWIGEVDAASGAPREIAGGRFVYGLVRDLPDGGRLFSRTDATHPPELYRLDSGAAEPRRLTRFYDAWLASRRLSIPEKIVAANSAGDAVEAWLYPPLDLPADGRAASKKFPLVVYIHGGPQGFDGDFFDFDLENQIFPAAGWGVLRVNYRGSTSYGEKFSRAIWGDWHSREFEDLMAALDRAIATRPWIDPDRLGIGGWSYGGIMTLWTVGHTDRFAVAVPERFEADYLSAFGEDQWALWYLSELGSPLDNAELYRRLSPGTYVKNIRTPLYLIANEDDFNCPLPQVLQLYQRLHLLGQKPELVVYPDESHSMSVPSHYADRLRRLLAWFGRHLDR